MGKLVYRYNPVKYPSACPSCDEPTEDSKHVVTCPNPERRKWQAALKTSLWHRSHGVPEPMAHLLHSQTTIGLDNFLLGRWSKHWTTLQLQYLQWNHIEVKNKNHVLSWSSNIIRLMWDHCYKEWKTRNKARHGNNAKDNTQRQLEKAHQTIRDLYDLKPKCSLQAQRHYFYPAVEDHFCTDTVASSLENWLETYEPMIMQNIRHRQTNSDHGLRLIDEVFQQTRTVPPHNPTPTMVSRQRTPRLTTRPINTYFLPNRITSPTSTLETTTPQGEQPPHQTIPLPYQLNHHKPKDKQTIKQTPTHKKMLIPISHVFLSNQMNFSSSRRRFYYHYYRSRPAVPCPSGPGW
ncbi:hypothetical protein IV203_010708 [Nitzschia inconspicua]|uniref:Uncharacterized protein n=1 Tax=Nitzschia inconspicua TaxID=303405 RepID=A0A9K3KY20_9STRA|nr:hypothetical protein IV203_010708 [Nitzschia inconspicua]